MTPWLPSPLNCLQNKRKAHLPTSSAAMHICGHGLKDLQLENKTLQLRTGQLGLSLLPRSISTLTCLLLPYLTPTNGAFILLVFNLFFFLHFCLVILFKSWLRCSVYFLSIFPLSLLARVPALLLAGALSQLLFSQCSPPGSPLNSGEQKGFTELAQSYSDWSLESVLPLTNP